MAKSTSTSAPSDTKTHTIARIVSPLAALTNLDGYMSAAGYDADHPWRTEIATALAAHGQVDSSIGHALDALNIACVARIFLNDNIHPVLTALVELSDFDCTDVAADWKRMGLIRGLAKLGRQLADEAAACMESEEREMQSKLDLLEGGAA